MQEVQDMTFEGVVGPGEAKLHPLRHMLTRAVGTGEPLPLVDTRIDPLQKKIVFCYVRMGYITLYPINAFLSCCPSHPLLLTQLRIW